MMQKPCPRCGVLVPESLSRCPNCGAGFFVPTPLASPPSHLTGQGWLDLLVGLTLSLIVPALLAKVFLSVPTAGALGMIVPGSWWLGTIVAFFVMRRRYRALSTGLLLGALLWLILGLALVLIVLGFIAVCSGMK